MTIEAALGTDAPFDERLQALRPHPGQAASAANLRRLLAGSPILASHRDSPHLVQDAYSLRCAPQVHGATRDALALRARRARDRDRTASATTRSCCPTSRRGRERRELPRAAGGGGARHRGAALVSLASISERRLYRLLDRTPVQRAAAVPRARERAQLRLHARAVHGGVARERVEVARPPGVGGLDPVERGPGGPREHGHDVGPPRARDRRQRRDRARARGARRGAGARPAGAARAGAGNAAPCTTRSGRTCRSSRPTASSAPTSPTP